MPRVTFAERIGYSPSNYANMIARGSKPGSDLLSALVAHTAVNPAWLLTGEGDMLKSGSATTTDAARPASEHAPVSRQGQHQEREQGEDVPSLIAGLVREFGNLRERVGRAEGVLGMGSPGRDLQAEALLQEGLKRAAEDRDKEAPKPAAGSQG